MSGTRPWVAFGVAVLGLVLALGAGVWGLGADRDPGHAHSDRALAAEGWVDVPGGSLRVRGASDRSVDHRKMSGMQTMADPDPVPTGLLRLSVDVDLAAGEDELAWSSRDFVVRGDQMRAATPHRVQLGDGVVPRLSSVAGALVFDVPERATGLSLRFRDSSPVPLQTPDSSLSHGGDGEGGHEH